MTGPWSVSSASVALDGPDLHRKRDHEHEKRSEGGQESSPSRRVLGLGVTDESADLLRGLRPGRGDLVEIAALERVDCRPREREGVVEVAALVIDRPVWLVYMYTVVGSLFFPFVISTLLWMNNSRLMPAAYRSGRAINSERVRAPTLRIMRVLWTSTVRWLMPSRSAIARLS